MAFPCSKITIINDKKVFLCSSLTSNECATRGKLESHKGLKLYLYHSETLLGHWGKLRWGPTVYKCHKQAINTAQENIIGNRPVEEAKKIKYYKRPIYKQFAQISSLCGPQFLSYLHKHFTHLCRVLYGDAKLVDRNCPPIWPPEINKNIRSSLFLLKLFLLTREPAYVRINTSLNTWNAG